MDELTQPEAYQPISKGPVFAVIALAILTPLIAVNVIYRLLKKMVRHV